MSAKLSLRALLLWAMAMLVASGALATRFTAKPAAPLPSASSAAPSPAGQSGVVYVVSRGNWG